MMDMLPYVRMRDEGMSAEQIYVAAKVQYGNNISYIRLFRELFGVSLGEARKIIAKAEIYFFQHQIVPKFQNLRKNGASPDEIYALAQQDGFSHLDRFRIVMATFELSITETKQVLQNRE